ncbi:histidine kinase [Microbacterium sp.]|uniref:sensor histidine kinase n=1 Tax=Microbacterium sp. TaxID=51671 RepID=UPI00289BCD8A|nr:histidine kinase [Microbacterium sp.]
MPDRRSRSVDVPRDVDLRLPRAPGVIRRFWARHPLFADILIALVALTLSIGPATRALPPGQGGSATALPSPVVLAAAVIAAAALLLRRRFPVAVAVVATLAAAAMMLAPSPGSAPLLMIAVYAVPVYRSTRVAWICWAGAGAALIVLATAGVLFGGAAPADVSNIVITNLGSSLIGVLVGINVGNRKRYVEAIIDRSRQLLVERDQQAQLAAAAERARIAREMHDIVSHSLTVVVALAEGATATDDPVRARRATAQISDTARDALREMRAMLGVLRDGAPDAPLAVVDGDPIAASVAAARRAGFPVTVQLSGAYPKPAPVRRALARIVQESLTNAMRHAPQSTGIDVAIATTASATTVTVSNDGVTGSPNVGGYGLRGLRERADHVGGTLEAGPAEGGRWRVHARLPLGQPPSPTREDR